MHFSKVRSLTLDTWEPELLKVSKKKVYKQMHMNGLPWLHTVFILLSLCLLIKSIKDQEE